MRFIYTTLALIIMASGAMAQEKLSLEGALSYALQNSTALEQARLDIEQSQQKVTEIRASGLPQVSVSSSLTFNPIVQQFVLPAEAFGGDPGEFMAIRAGQNWNAMTQVQLSQQLFNKQLLAGMKAAQGSEEYYRLLKELSEENLIQQVAANYYMVIINQEKLKAIQSNLQRISQLEKIVEEQYNLGLAKKIDLDRIAVNVSNMETQKVELKRALAQQKNLLKYYADMPMEEEIHLSDLTTEDLEKGLQIIPASLSYQADDILDYKILKKQKDLLELEREATKAEYYPSLSLDANYLYNTQSEKLNMYSSKALNYDMSSISLRLTIPIFDGFSKRSRVKQSDISLQKINREMSQTRNSLFMANENAKNQVNSSLKIISNQKANRTLAMDVFHNTQNNYKNGLASLTDLLNAESDLVLAQNSYNEALLNYKIAEIDFVRSQGKIKTLLINN